MNDNDAVLILKEERTPAGANRPTIHKEYLCPCGKGRIIEERVPGFDDWFATIECITCSKKYRIVMGRGHIWETEEM